MSLMKDFNNVVQFSQSSETSNKLIRAMQDYAVQSLQQSNKENYEHLGNPHSGTMSQKEKAINKIFMEEVQRMSGYKSDIFNGDLVRFGQFPLINHFSQTIQDIMIDAIMPYVYSNASLSFICEMHYKQYGKDFKFDIEDNSLYRVSKADRRAKHTQAQRKEKNTVSITTDNYDVTTYSNLPEIMLGNVSIAREVMRSAMSIQKKIYSLVLGEFKKTMSDITNPALKLTGITDEKEVIKRLQAVSVYNNAQAIIVGDAVALKSLLPSAQNQRILLSDEFNTTLGYMRTYNTYNTMSFEPVASDDGAFGLTKLPENQLYVVSPSARKMIHVAVGDTMSNTDGSYDNANLGILSTMKKEIGVRLATSSIAARLDIA